MPYILPENYTYLPSSYTLRSYPAMAPSVYILLHRDTESNITITSVFLDLQDANAALLHQAQEAGVDPATAKPTAGDAKDSLAKSPLRWEAADGTAAWVERHTVTNRKSHAPGADKPGLKRNDSRLYINDDDDVIEVADHDGHYD
ncbi:actin polymerization protein [Fusarium austroafricanum]|uniref:Actin polymerization protein n=1 Tax=Fusarium austroafricanum TaxID=2364996 RepID=A0A8H4NUC8_9HYPO|nr:actin polymerization protein [Fusarium austroafricanum]